LSQLYHQPFLTINGAIEYFKYSGEIDVLRTFLSYTISRFTESQAILTMVYAFIFGYFFSRNIWYVFGLLKGKISFLEKVLLLALILVVPIWLINGFRMWTAFHVFMYGLLSGLSLFGFLATTFTEKNAVGIFSNSFLCLWTNSTTLLRAFACSISKPPGDRAGIWPV